MHLFQKDGFEATIDIRKHEVENNIPKIRICALTADNSKNNEEKCYKVGMDFFLAKPASSKQLAVVLNSGSVSSSPSLLESPDRSPPRSIPKVDHIQPSLNGPLSGN